MQSFEVPGFIVPSFEVLTQQMLWKYLVKGVLDDIGDLFSGPAIVPPMIEAIMFILSIIFIGDGNYVFDLFE